jgi:hypothetical protein
MVRRGALLTIAALALLAHASPVYGAYGDPPIGSPSGAVYQLPFEQGRSDAAPKSGGTPTGSAGGGGAQGDGTTSLYRSENNFGSSSQVPGLPSSGGSGPGTGGGIGGGAGNAAAGAGGGGAALGGAALTGAVTLADSGNASVPGSIVLLAVIALFAAAIGVFSSRAMQRAS